MTKATLIEGEFNWGLLIVSEAESTATVVGGRHGAGAGAGAGADLQAERQNKNQVWYGLLKPQNLFPSTRPHLLILIILLESYPLLMTEHSNI
jgi:hypothetical protein